MAVGRNGARFPIRTISIGYVLKLARIGWGLNNSRKLKFKNIHMSFPQTVDKVSSTFYFNVLKTIHNIANRNVFFEAQSMPMNNFRHSATCPQLPLDCI